MNKMVFNNNKKSNVKNLLKSNWEVTLSTNVVKTFQGMYLYMFNIFFDNLGIPIYIHSSIVLMQLNFCDHS
jgi:hypothetical protein